MSNENSPDDSFLDFIIEANLSQNEIVELNIQDFYNNIKTIDKTIQESDTISSHLINTLLDVRNDLFLDIAEELNQYQPNHIH